MRKWLNRPKRKIKSSAMGRLLRGGGIETKTECWTIVGHGKMRQNVSQAEQSTNLKALSLKWICCVLETSTRPECLEVVNEKRNYRKEYDGERRPLTQGLGSRAQEHCARQILPGVFMLIYFKAIYYYLQSIARKKCFLDLFRGLRESVWFFYID